MGRPRFGRRLPLVAIAFAALATALAPPSHAAPPNDALFRAEIGSPVGFELGGKVLGTIGCGRTGGRLGEIATGLGMTVLTVDSTSVATEWEALLSRADFVSVHCPLDQSTYGLIGRWAFERMKRGVFLINCARGPIARPGRFRKRRARDPGGVDET